MKQTKQSIRLVWNSHEARWTLNDQDEDKEVDLQSSEEKEMILSYINAELDCIGKYKANTKKKRERILR